MTDAEASFPLTTIKRWLDSGFEYVELTYTKDWLYLLKLLSSQTTKEKYKIALAELCGYPASEWTRIHSVTPKLLPDGGYSITIKFRNIGKCFEHWINSYHHEFLTPVKHDEGMLEFVHSGCALYIDKEAIQ